MQTKFSPRTDLDRLARIREAQERVEDIGRRMNEMNVPGTLTFPKLRPLEEIVYVLPVERICKNCAWWNGAADSLVAGCSNPRLNVDYEEESSCGDDYLWAENNSVLTGPRFGCVHFTVAPEDEPK